MKARRLLAMVAAITWVVQAGGTGTFAQAPPASPPHEEHVIYFRQSLPPPGQAAGAIGMAAGASAAGALVHDTVSFVSGMGPGAGPQIQGAPYSAEAVTEIVQTLADGNRITRKTTVSMHRDGEGRTRRDQSVGASGPWMDTTDALQTSFISDPVAGTSYLLDHRTRTARELPVPRMMTRPLPAPPTEASAGVPLPEPSAVQGGRGMAPAIGRVRPFLSLFPQGDSNPGLGQDFRIMAGDHPASEAREETLGKRLVEGVEAQGTRSVLTIPAGAIGNELPIEITSERWYAPSLQTVVLSIHNDPRFGQTTYRLTNVRLSEPPPSLFEVPPDYTLVSRSSDLSFEQCAAAGNPVLESSPRQCRTPDGRTLVEGDAATGPRMIWRGLREFNVPAAP